MHLQVMRSMSGPPSWVVDKVDEYTSDFTLYDDALKNSGEETCEQLHRVVLGGCEDRCSGNAVVMLVFQCYVDEPACYGVLIHQFMEKYGHDECLFEC